MRRADLGVEFLDRRFGGRGGVVHLEAPVAEFLFVTLVQAFEHVARGGDKVAHGAGCQLAGLTEGHVAVLGGGLGLLGQGFGGGVVGVRRGRLGGEVRNAGDAVEGTAISSLD